MPLPSWHAHAIAACILSPLLSSTCISPSRRQVNHTSLNLAAKRLEAQDCDLELDLSFLLPPSGTLPHSFLGPLNNTTTNDNDNTHASSSTGSAASAVGGGNSLSAALRAAAAASFSSTPQEVALSHDCSFVAMRDWIVEHGVKAHPSVIQVAERGWKSATSKDTTDGISTSNAFLDPRSSGESAWTSGQPQPQLQSQSQSQSQWHRRRARVKRVGKTLGYENSMADKMGGGSSAGGLNFNFDSIAEDLNTTSTTSGAAMEMSRRIENVIGQRLLRPYEEMVRFGLPPLRRDGGVQRSAAQAVQGMSGFSRALESWASAHVSSYQAQLRVQLASSSSSSPSTKTLSAPPLEKSFVKQALSEYASLMQDLQKRCNVAPSKTISKRLKLLSRSGIRMFADKASDDATIQGHAGAQAGAGAGAEADAVAEAQEDGEGVMLDREELAELLLEGGAGVRLAWTVSTVASDRRASSAPLSLPRLFPPLRSLQLCTCTSCASLLLVAAHSDRHSD